LRKPSRHQPTAVSCTRCDARTSFLVLGRLMLDQPPERARTSGHEHPDNREARGASPQPANPSDRAGAERHRRSPSRSRQRPAEPAASPARDADRQLQPSGEARTTLPSVPTPGGEKWPSVPTPGREHGPTPKELRRDERRPTFGREYRDKPRGARPIPRPQPTHKRRAPSGTTPPLSGRCLRTQPPPHRVFRRE
jgi:hypothetical protein